MCVLYINTRKTQLRRQGTANMVVANSLQMLKTVIMDFSVIKPHFSRRLSQLFFSAGSQLSHIFRGVLSTNGGWRPAKSAAWGSKHGSQLLSG